VINTAVPVQLPQRIEHLRRGDGSRVVVGSSTSSTFAAEEHQLGQS